MRTRTQRWDAAVLQSHTIAISASILYAGQTIDEDLAVRSGRVTLDRTAASLGRCDVELAEPYAIPTSTGGALSPYGYEIAIQHGIAYPDGTTELMPLGVFPIQRSQIDGVTLLTQVSAIDRTQLVRDARFEDDYQIAAGTNYGTAIMAMIGAGVAGLTYLFADVTFTTPLLTQSAGDDRWDAGRDMAKACGCELFFDGLGRLVLRPEPAFDQPPVWSIVEGAGGAMTSASLSLDRATAYNAVIATGENSSLGSVYRAIEVDNDPSSATYYYGGFGRKPRFYASPLITSTEQAQSAAASILRSTRGVARAVDLGALPNPALEPGDPISVKRTALNLDEVHLVDSMVVDLSIGSMTCSTRARAA